MRRLRQCQLLCHNKSRALPCSAGPPRRAMPPNTLPVRRAQAAENLISFLPRFGDTGSLKRRLS